MLSSIKIISFFHIASKNKVYLRRQKGVYLLDVQMPNGNWKEITVVSGAADNVCPWEWAKEFGLNEIAEENRIRFVGPNGSPIQHYGNRLVRVQAMSSVF